MNWNKRRVFLTGHTGFKGGWLALWLQHLGADVAGYALESPTRPGLFEVASIASGMKSHIGDVRNLQKLTQELHNAKPEIIFHLAAQPLVRYSYVKPIETYATNVMGTAHVLEAARTCDTVRAVVIVTTDKCYANREWIWPYRENDPMGGYDPYSSSKGCAELVTASYRDSFFNSGSVGNSAKIATARAGNVIGGGDWAKDRLIPDMIRGICTQQMIRIRYPYATRPWQHVLEPLRGYIALAERLYDDGEAFASAWNFGPFGQDSMAVIDVVKQFSAAWPKARWEIDKGDHVHEAENLRLDCTKAANLLNWLPKISIQEGVDLHLCREDRRYYFLTRD